MAGFAADIDVRPGGLVRVGLNIVVFLQVGGMARGAHAVPVHGCIGPILPVFRVYRMVRVQVIPPPAFHIPGDGQALHPAAGKRDQILLKGIPPESVGNLEIAHNAIRPLGMDKELAVLAVEPGDDAEAFKGGIVEIATHTGFGGDIHGMKVIGAFPQLIFRLMAGPAFLAADEICGSAPLYLPGTVMMLNDRKRYRNHDQCGGENSNNFPAEHIGLNL